jgi:hypothetical protein
MKFIKLFDFIDRTVDNDIAYIFELVTMEHPEGGTLNDKCLFQIFYESLDVCDSSLPLFKMGVSGFDCSDVFRIYFSIKTYTVQLGIFSYSYHNSKDQ